VLFFISFHIVTFLLPCLQIWRAFRPMLPL
jgi:hypothetical protein